jgi:cellulose synthase/poly-beta-1,6-N-acetylglucosamine synthase-like glycosyltransferase
MLARRYQIGLWLAATALLAALLMLSFFGVQTRPFPRLFAFTLAPILLLVGTYAVRHYYFTLNRLFGMQRHPYIDINVADWPTVTVFVAAHNEEAVIADSLTALLEVNYPADKLTIMPINDRSTDHTKEIIDEFVANNPGRIVSFHRTGGKPGKAAALKDATELVTSEIIVVFDADYLPSRGLIKQLVAPFFDPEVGATMGRVVPVNVGSNLLTRLLDLERAGGYQVDQQARMNLGMVPQYGGTVGGVRVSALKSIGGWHDDVLAEDTDLTYRLLLKNWKTVYQNRSECYEEVPQNWSVRVRQIMRWAKGHNQALYRHFWKVIAKRGMSWSEKIDGLALLAIYAMAPLLIVGWLIIIAFYYFERMPFISGIVALFALVAFSALGNFAVYFEIAAAAYLDRSRQRIRLLPFVCVSFLVSVFSISMATVDQIIFDRLRKHEFRWDKTVRYRKAKAN